MKRLAVVILMLVAGLFAGTYSGEGDGSSGDPYQIETLADLLELSTTQADWVAGKYFKQTIDLVFAASDFENGGDFYNAGMGFSPIGSSSVKFAGTYDGDGHTIDGLYINRSSSDYIGLFGYLYGGTIQNLGVTNVNITGHDYTGGLVGNAEFSSSISKSYSTGTVNANYYLGGLIGYNTESPISDSYSTASVTASVNGQGHYMGGLVGSNNASTISNSYSTGSVSGGFEEGFMGGLVGSCANTTTIHNCFWDNVTSGQASSYGGTGKTTTEMKSLATFTATATEGLTTAWDFVTNPNDDVANNDYWDMDLSEDINNGYPYLSWQDGADQSLPVELSFWQVESKNGQVTLSWLTDSESENMGFIIERSDAQSGPFKELASFATDKALNGAGSSSHAHEYKWIDTDVKAGESWYYRLSDMTYSGKVTRHAVLHIVVKSANLDLKPHDFTLQPAYPNPFNPSTSIRYGLAEETNVRVMIYDMRGIEIQVLEQGPKSAGWYELQWHGTDAQGRQLASGLYMLMFRAGSQQVIQKLMFLK